LASIVPVLASLLVARRVCHIIFLDTNHHGAFDVLLLTSRTFSSSLVDEFEHSVAKLVLTLNGAALSAECVGVVGSVSHWGHVGVSGFVLEKSVRS